MNTYEKFGYFSDRDVDIIFSTAWSVSVTRSAEFFLDPDTDVLGVADVIILPALWAICTRKSWTSCKLMSDIFLSYQSVN